MSLELGVRPPKLERAKRLERIVRDTVATNW